jgi:hypothetical protein
VPTPTYLFPPLVPSDPDAVAADIAAALERAWDRVEIMREEVLAAVESGARTRALARLRDYQKAVENFQSAVDDEAGRFVGLVTGQYAAGLEAASAYLGVTTTWTLTNRTALAALASDSYADLLARSVQAGKTSTAFARAVRTAAKQDLPLQATGGTTAQQAGKELRRTLEDRFHIGAVTYRDGSVHSAREYTEMAARTKGRVAYNSGNLAGYREAGITYMEVFDGSSCGWETHRDQDLANGSIRTLEACDAHPISHPNCRRSFGPRPDIKTGKQAAEADPLQDLTPHAEFASVPSTTTSARAAAGAARRDALASRRAARAG